jgi:hypothetical protein
MKTNFLQKLTAGTAALALLASVTVVPKADAQANEIATVYWANTGTYTDTATIDPVATATALNAAFDFTTVADLAAGDNIVVRVPDAMTIAPAFTAGDVVISGTGFTSGGAWSNGPAVAATGESTGADGATLTAATAGLAGNQFNVVITDDNATDCATATLGGTSPNYAIACDLDGSAAGTGLTATALTALIDGAADLSATVKGTGTNLVTADTIQLTGGLDANAENEVILTLDSALTAGSTVTVTFTDTNAFVTTPAEAGQYGFSVRTEEASGIVLDTGVALLSVAGGVSVNAVVQEALIMTVDANIVNLVVDPSVNNGQDKGQSSTLVIATNAESYNIEAKIDNGVNANASLYNADAGTEIFSNTYAAANNNENYFGFTLTPGSDADVAFGTAGANLFGAPQAGITNSNAHSVYYDLNVDYLTQAGLYEGTVYFTAVPTF